MLKHGALFAGMGGFIEAAHRENYVTLWANEIEPKCSEVLRANYPDTEINSKSISELDHGDVAHLPDLDLLTAGFPCQSFSQAKGVVAGFDDPRGKLFFDIPRVISLLVRPPKVVLLENVPVLKKFDKGSMLSTVLNEMRFAGYWVQERHAKILNSSEYGGTPQQRERLFIVCVHKDHARRNNFDFDLLRRVERPGLFEIVDRSKAAPDRIYLAEDNKYYKKMAKLADAKNRNRLFQIRQVEARAIRDDSCPTLTANMGGGGHNVPFVFDTKGLRRLTVEECMRLQGFDPHTFLIPEGLADSTVLKMIGNAVSVGTVASIMRSLREQGIFPDMLGSERDNDCLEISA